MRAYAGTYQLPSSAPCRNARHANRSITHHARAQYGGPTASEPVRVSRWEPLTSSPVALLTLGPRAVLGAILLAPQPDRLFKEASKLLQTPQAAEDAILTCIERGASAEAHAVQLALAFLPQELRAALPGSSAASSPSKGPGSSGAGGDPASRGYVAETAAMDTGAAVELESLRLAVSAVCSAVENMRSSPDPAMRGLLILGVREARDSLSRQLAQVSAATYAAKDVPTISAADEATRLLNDLDGLLAESM